MRNTISVLMIVKNEEALLERALQSTIGADNWFILDTGSQDRTIEIAEKFGATVFRDYVWADSFCEAQNHLLGKVRDRVDIDAAWILSLDADEMLLTGIESVKEAISKARDTVRVKMVAEGPNKVDFFFARIFRNCPEIYWEKPIHKHLNVPGEGEEVGNVSIMFGWSPAHLNDPDRSLRMLEAAAESPTCTPRELYYLGREYFYKKRYREAIATMDRYVKVGYWAAEVADAYMIMANCWLELGYLEDKVLAEKSADCALQAIKINSNFKEAILHMADIAIPENKKQWERMARTANNAGVLWDRVPVDSVPNIVFIAPHNDDEVLFGAFTLMREKPTVIVVTDSYIQPERGDVGCSAEIRRQETINAMAIIGCPVVFLGIKDTELTEAGLRERLKPFNPEKVYAPAKQGGNAQHDIVHSVCKELFTDRCEFYTTYTKTELYTTGNIEVKPIHNELEIKEKMMACYKSQLELPSTRPHFEAVRGKSEWLYKGLRKILICPYFGEFPEWMNKFKAPAGYDLLLDTDLEGFKQRVKSKLAIDFPGVWGSAKVHDYRCALGLLYEDEIKEYDYWGTVDLDMCFGEVDKWFPDSLIRQYDVISNHDTYVSGPFSLYKNSMEVNTLFFKEEVWPKYLIMPESNAWVEKEFSRLLERSGLKYLYTSMQGNPWCKELNLKKENGVLYQDGIPIPMFHFRHFKHLGWPL